MKVVQKSNGKFGVQRGNGAVLGDFNSYAEALFAICEANAADTHRPEQ